MVTRITEVSNRNELRRLEFGSIVKINDNECVLPAVFEKIIGEEYYFISGAKGNYRLKEEQVSFENGCIIINSRCLER